jgi:hypothetical protein
VSRSAAERHLRAILTSGVPDAEPSEAMSWSLTEHEPPLPSPESHLEQSFRKVFTERVTALGATVKETPAPKGNRLSITFPGAARQWTLEPQFSIGSSRPDFVLRSSQGSLPLVAIFTDGWAYHASSAHNRLADDARKRQELRDSGVIVLGITARDVEHARDGTFEKPGWLNSDVIAALMSSTVTFRPQNVEAIRRGPVDFLLSWIQSPDVDGHRVLADRLPFLFVPTATQFTMDPAVDLAREAARRLLDPDRITPPGDVPSVAWWWSAHSVGFLTRTSGDHLELARVEVALVIDDRTEVLADKDQGADDWREWLRIANALNLREQPTIITTITGEDGGVVRDKAQHDLVRPDDLGGAALSPSWQVVHDLATGGPERLFIEELARHTAAEPIPMPVVGYEAENGTPVNFAWPDARIAVCLDAGDRRDLESDGWRVFTDDADAVLMALREAT